LEVSTIFISNIELNTVFCVRNARGLTTAQLAKTRGRILTKNFNSEQQTVRDRVADRLDLTLLSAVAAAEDATARLDERLHNSPLCDGLAVRGHFGDACAALWLAGELVHLEDLVFHDAEMDLRTPTHELTRAHAVLRARRRIAASPPGRFLQSVEALGDGAEEPAHEEDAEQDLPQSDEDRLVDEFAAIDAAIARSSKLLRESPGAVPGRELVYDEDFDQDARFASWRREVEATENLAPTLAAAVALEAWREIEPLEHQNWLGTLLVADLLRQRGKARHHLPCLSIGLRAVPRARRSSRDAAERLLATLEAIAAAARAGLDEHDRLALAEAGFRRRCAGLRSNAKLPALAELVMSKPLVTAPMIARELKISARAAQDMAPMLGLRELTGRGRFRAWGV
jgi:hypothetical protein